MSNGRWDCEIINGKWEHKQSTVLRIFHGRCPSEVWRHRRFQREHRRCFFEVWRHIGDILSSDEPLSLRLALQHIVHLRERCGFKAILMAVPQHHLQLPIQRLIQPCCIGHRVAMPRRGKTKCTIRWCFGIRAPCSSRIRTMCLLSKSHIS